MIRNFDEFSKFCENYKAKLSYKKPVVWGFVRLDEFENINYEILNYNSNFNSAIAMMWALGELSLDDKVNLVKLNKSIISKALEVLGFLDPQNHKNLQTILKIDEIFQKDISSDEFYVVFAFEEVDNLDKIIKNLIK